MSEATNMKEVTNKTIIVLVGTTHPGNIGAAARAMKTMSQDKLYLVNPKIFPAEEATARASGADDILTDAKIFSSLKEAIADCDLVIGTSARTRNIPWPLVSPRKCADIISDNKYSSVAIIFGRENSGLSNDELVLCNLALKIPANAVYSSLNLAAAVQIICYEIYLSGIDHDSLESLASGAPLADQKTMALFYQHLEEVMISIGFHNTENPRLLMHRMRRLFNRAQLEENECNILRGILSKIQSKIKFD